MHAIQRIGVQKRELISRPGRDFEEVGSVHAHPAGLERLKNVAGQQQLVAYDGDWADEAGHETVIG
jgi:hypothetical protein